ncbi:MAG: adenine glycosylase [Eggerthellaceae bacterium]|nr:adenine glycosylase [Eggerthellaceae bacterium]
MASKKHAGASAKARTFEADWSGVAQSRDAFVSKVREEGLARYRDLPWRNIDDAYGVLVSEVMLQQTQVSRVLRYWERWMGLFPTIDALAAADTPLVLEMWQGLGYNRRALALKRACEACAAEYAGYLPETADELVKLPGIGPATAAGIMAFAYNRPAVYLETNVRSVFLHELFPEREGVSDKELVPYIADTCPTGDSALEASRDEWGPRAWYYALLDYGAYLKSQVANPSRRSAHHARQSKFEGSHREKRSFVLKRVLAHPDGIATSEVIAALNAHERDAGRDALDTEICEALVAELVSEGFFRMQDNLLVP